MRSYSASSSENCDERSGTPGRDRRSYASHSTNFRFGYHVRLRRKRRYRSSKTGWGKTNTSKPRSWERAVVNEAQSHRWCCSDVGLLQYLKEMDMNLFLLLSELLRPLQRGVNDHPKHVAQVALTSRRYTYKHVSLDGGVNQMQTSFFALMLAVTVIIPVNATAVFDS